MASANSIKLRRNIRFKAAAFARCFDVLAQRKNQGYPTMNTKSGKIRS